MVFLVSLFSYSLVWFMLVCAVCRARAGLVKQHDRGVAFLNMLGVATLFDLACLLSVFMRSGLTVRSSSRLSDYFCSCWSGRVRAVLVWSSWYNWAGLISFALFCFAHLVCIGLVEAALFQAGVLSLSSVLPCSLWSVLVWSTPLYSRLVSSRLFCWFVLLQLGLV